MFKRDKKQLTPSSRLLLLLLKINYYHGLSMDFGVMRKAVYRERTIYDAKRSLQRLTYELKKKGWISYEYKETKRVIKLTERPAGSVI